MKTYIIRAAKYAIYLILLLVIIFTLMNSLTKNQTSFADLFTTSRGIYMAFVVLIFAAIYPMMGYVKRTLVFDASQKVDEVVNVMSLSGYARTDAGDAAAMTFRAVGKMKRLSLMGEDQITITTTEGLSTIAGPRKEVVRVSFRFTTFIS